MWFHFTWSIQPRTHGTLAYGRVFVSVSESSTTLTLSIRSLCALWYYLTPRTCIETSISSVGYTGIFYGYLDSTQRFGVGSRYIWKMPSSVMIYTSTGYCLRNVFVLIMTSYCIIMSYSHCRSSRVDIAEIHLVLPGSSRRGTVHTVPFFLDLSSHLDNIVHMIVIVLWLFSMSDRVIIPWWVSTN